MAGSIRDLSRYRYEKSVEQIKVAETLIQNEMYSVSLNRSYYAIFHAMRAVNALDDFDSGKHSGVIAHFNQYHVKTGEFGKNTSRIIRNAADLREQADYEDFYAADAQEAKDILDKAKTFIMDVEAYLKQHGVI